MTKLPDNETLLRYYREGLTNAQIAEAYGVTHQAVTFRFTKMGIERKPEKNTATAIIEAAFPSSEIRRSDYTQFNRARQLFSFIRWRLGDETLSERQVASAKKLATHELTNGVVLALDVESKPPWVWLPRTPADGRLILRWPDGRELPKGPHLKAITLPRLEECLENPPKTSVTR